MVAGDHNTQRDMHVTRKSVAPPQGELLLYNSAKIKDIKDKSNSEAER